jgi:hypothetical protein
MSQKYKIQYNQGPIPVLNTADTGKNQSGIQYRYSLPGKNRAVLNTGIHYREKSRAVLNTDIQYRKKAERY